MERAPWVFDEFQHLGVDFGDPHQVATYDARQHTDLMQERQFVQALGIAPTQTVLEYGCGTGALALAAAEAGAHVVAVDVSAAMLAYAQQRAHAHGVDTIRFQHAGFLTYRHAAAPVEWVITQYALHHLPDFWKSTALVNINRHLAPGGRFVLRDVIYSFVPTAYQQEIERWIAEQTGVGSSFTRRDFEAHVRDEYSTYAWLLEALLMRSGFRVDSYDAASPVYGLFMCTKTAEV